MIASAFHYQLHGGSYAQLHYFARNKMRKFKNACVRSLHSRIPEGVEIDGVESRTNRLWLPTFIFLALEWIPRHCCNVAQRVPLPGTNPLLCEWLAEKSLSRSLSHCSVVSSHTPPQCRSTAGSQGALRCLAPLVHLPSHVQRRLSSDLTAEA